MKHTSLSDGYGLFAGLIEQAQPETRDQATLILTHARVRSAIAADRRRELQALWRVRVALLGIAFAVLCSWDWWTRPVTMWEPMSWHTCAPVGRSWR